jgi:ankyrin repeat protein
MLTSPSFDPYDAPTTVLDEESDAEFGKFLLHAGEIDPNSSDHLQRTPLMYALESGHAPLARLLIQHPQTDLNAECGFNNTRALDYALSVAFYRQPKRSLESCRRESCYWIELLLKHGAIPSVQLHLLIRHFDWPLPYSEFVAGIKK